MHHARLELQRIDDEFIDLIVEDKGAAVRRSLKQVVTDLGPLPALAIELTEDAEHEVNFDDLTPLIDSLGSRLALAMNWTIEADDCWNSSCSVQELDEARDAILDSIGLLMQIEKL